MLNAKYFSKPSNMEGSKRKLTDDDWTELENRLNKCHDEGNRIVIYTARGMSVNQGNIHTWDSDIVSQAMDQAVSKKGQINKAGEELKSKFSYSNAVDSLIKGVEGDL